VTIAKVFVPVVKDPIVDALTVPAEFVPVALK